ncbi:hypothetical protein F2Q70_00020461 [Brassica cretica]|uniref:Uncharacterized protein n=1 Tax=Brassica cretica TaxID=69181 RepID=A0A8S9GIF9_BRACR|nr:hypothetical protein F2Q70_00020461 [Brassica cretica]
MGVEKYSGLIAGQKFAGMTEIRRMDREARGGLVLTCRSTRWIDQAQVMQPDIWEEWWHPACVLDMQPAMWSTRCRRACVRSHVKRHTGCHQPEADWLLPSINRQCLPSASTHPDLSKPTSREGSVQLKVNQVKISSDGKQVNVAREGERHKVVDLEYCRFSPRRPVVMRKLCPNDSVQASHILLQSSGDQSVEACQFLHGKAEVLSKSRSVQSSPVKSSLGFWPSHLRSSSCFSPKNTVALGKDDRIAWCWTLGPPE